jgi:hypothetical protein
MEQSNTSNNKVHWLSKYTNKVHWLSKQIYNKVPWLSKQIYNKVPWLSKQIYIIYNISSVKFNVDLVEEKKLHS